MGSMFETEADAQAALDEVGAALGLTITLDPALPRASTSAALGWAQGWTDGVLVTVGAWPEGFSLWVSPMTDGGDRWSGVRPTLAEAARSLVGGAA